MSTSFAQPPQGRTAVGCATLFFGLFAVGIAIQLGSYSIPLAVIPLVGLFVLLAGVYYVFNEEQRVTIDERSIRLTTTRVIFGARLGEQLLWEIPAAELTKAREVRSRTPASRGGWNHSTKLQLARGITLDATMLGGREDAASPYNALVAFLEKRLGDAFEREERTV